MMRWYKTVAVYLLYDNLCGPQRDIWVHELLTQRDQQSEFILAQQILIGEEEKCQQYLRMNRQQFDFILSLVEPIIRKKDTYKRFCIPAQQRLIMTLRYLATGASQLHMAFSFRIGHSTIGFILRETLEALWDTLLPVVLAPPTLAKWLEIARDFEHLWQLPNCIGAIDGKHVRIIAPPNSGSEFYNYKGYFSLVLLAICDAHYRFVFVDIGNSGRHSDGGVFSNSRIGKAFENCELNIPAPRPLPGSAVNAPFFLAADDAFPLRAGIMKPYSGRSLNTSHRIFNYRLSRGRRTIENAFGILAVRWQIFFKTINGHPDLGVQIIQACVVLHNFLQAPTARFHIFGDQVAPDGVVIDGNWRLTVPLSVNFTSLGNSRANSYGRGPSQIRDDLKTYFLSTIGAVPWQWQHT